ncbi:HAD family hydrolase [Pseudoluteimonas lycopersici]|uniref:HAD family hydrolase n=1 Tax=Pseudoluteimonas lycopersici TaxID=1324796 RepID=A0A516V731_9GAMM|nr:HAD family hydrolase [Lysobacter lycopersici]QDQ74349.1 HAD family hydrolase [Lysobacter lycopersici]
MSIKLVGFDADDTLWKSEDYYRDAQARFEHIVASYVDLDDVGERMFAIEKRNLALFGYGAKGMTLSMLEAAVAITEARISAADLHRIIELGKGILRHPVALIPGIREAVADIAADFPVVLVTKGDLFHQEAKVRESGLADAFGRIEIVSEKDAKTYARLFREFEVEPREFLMVGNSLRSDIVPVLALGGWGVHMPYHVTWAHEQDAGGVPDPARFREVANASELPAAVRELAGAAQSAFTSPNAR